MKMIRSSFFLPILSLAMLLLTSPISADPAGKDCGPDYKKFCADIKPGEGRIGRCLMQHRDEISQKCLAFFQSETKSVLREFIAACQTDVANNCKGVQPGKGRIFRCLKNKPDKISSECTKVIKKL